MHSSIIITSLFAALAVVATPVHQALHKKDIVWDVVTDYVTVTVTAGDLPETVKVQNTVYVQPVAATTSSKKVKSSKSRRPRPNTTSTTTTPPLLPPTTTSTTTTTTPPPPPTTTVAPAPTATPEPTVVAEPTETVAPVQTKAPESVAEASTAPASTGGSASGSAGGSTSSTGDVVKDAALNFHNAKRAIHHVGSVSWNDALAADAAKLAGSCINDHKIYGSYGQNIASSAVSNPASPSDDLAKIMTDASAGWYNEVTEVNFSALNSVPGSVLHFTQLVWKDTTEIGCAVHYCGTTGNIFPASRGFTFYAYTIVCNYKAAGNVGGKYVDNVFAA